MMIEEFRKLQGSEFEPINQENYKLVEFVYTYHPMNLSKEAAVSLYDEFGMMMFLDLLPRAQRAAKIETEMKIARAHYEAKKAEYENLGDWRKEDYDLTI